MMQRAGTMSWAFYVSAMQHAVAVESELEKHAWQENMPIIL